MMIWHHHGRLTVLKLFLSLIEEEVIIMKLVVTGIVEGAAHLFPERADTFYKIGAIAGYCGGAWNTYQITSR